MQSLYQQIFRRKSFHRFTTPFANLSHEELLEIQVFFASCKPLVEGITIQLRITPVARTHCKSKGEYALQLYSEQKEGYLENIGYIGEQLDLFLTSKNIGVCWYGWGKSDEKTFEGLAFVIMLIIAKQEEDQFRKDYTKTTRLDEASIWEGPDPHTIAGIVRFAPSACNTQPWLVEARDNQVFMYRLFRKCGMMPLPLVPYFQSIDIGIFLLFLELTMQQKGLGFTRILASNESREGNKVLVATYTLLT